MASIFSRIVSGEIPSYKVAEDAEYLAFLDVAPLVMGHVLVVPKKEIDYIFDLDPNAISGMIQFAQKVAVAIKKVVPCKKVGLAAIGLEVPHAHIHLVPINGVGDINFTKEKLSPNQEELLLMAKKIREALL
jgi:histidine triad (HIT) family protein